MKVHSSFCPTREFADPLWFTDNRQKMTIFKCISLILHLQGWRNPKQRGQYGALLCFQILAGHLHSRPFSTTLSSFVHQNRTQGNHTYPEQQLFVWILILIASLVALHDSLPFPRIIDVTATVAFLRNVQELMKSVGGNTILTPLLCEDSKNFILSLQGLIFLLQLEHNRHPPSKAFPTDCALFKRVYQ